MFDGKLAAAKVGKWLLDVLFPEKITCLGCGRPSLGSNLCPDCRENVEKLRIRKDYCTQCGYPLIEGRCGFCERYHIDADGIRSALRHEGIPRKLIHDLKYNAIAAAATVLAAEMAEAANGLPVNDQTIITWAPMPDARRTQRGIDHARTLAEETASLLQIPCRALLYRPDRKKDRTQEGLTAEERLENLKMDCYLPIERLHGEQILLIDDVTTTGSTGNACVRALKSAGGGQIWVLTATRACEHELL